MRILKKGNLASLIKPEKFVCRVCGCEFIAEPREYEIADEHLQKSRGIRAISRCPMCESVTTLPLEK